MKRVKICIAIVCIVGGIYCVILCLSGRLVSAKLSSAASAEALCEGWEDGSLKKAPCPSEPWRSRKLHAKAGKTDDQQTVQQHNQNEPDQSVVIQRMAQVPCEKHQDVHDESDFIITDDEHNEPVAEIVSINQPELFVSADVAKSTAHHKKSKSHSHSFITMKISDDYQIDQETQETLDMLIGNDIDAFVKLVLQSNNNIVSKEACRSCGMHAFFNGIKHHKPLSAEDVRMLQKMLANLYRFAGKMQKLNKDVELMNSDQYEALQNLHTTQTVKNDLKLQARKATTAAALKKLQNIKYNK